MKAREEEGGEEKEGMGKEGEERGEEGRGGEGKYSSPTSSILLLNTDCDREMDGRSDIYKHLATANTASIHIESHYHV